MMRCSKGSELSVTAIEDLRSRGAGAGATIALSTAESRRS